MNKAREDNILVIEDDPFTRELLQEELHDLGYHATFLGNGVEALKTVRETKPDIILLDVMIPGMDGYSVCRALRKDPSTLHIPIIFITARGSTEDVIRGLELGANDYVTKPIDIQILNARLETQLRTKRLFDKVNKQNIELEALNTTIKEFLGMASHDLRTPASVINLIALTLLEDTTGPLSETQKVLLKKIYDQTSYMNTLLDSLLNIAHIESGKIALHLQPENLNNILEENLSALKFLARNKGIELALDTDPSMPPVLIDQIRFTEIIDNIVSNAIKFTRKGGKIRVRVFSTKPTDNGPWACVSIADSGIGIKASDLGKLFEKFSTFGPASSTGEKSTGLGLSIAKKLTELHHGKLEVTSKVEEGTEFVIKLPLRKFTP